MTGGTALLAAPRASADREARSTGRCMTKRSSVALTMFQPLARAEPMAKPLMSGRVAHGMRICGWLPE